MDKENYTIDIIDLVPVGQDNAISRRTLTEKCVAYGLIDGKERNPDRHMRRLLEKARETHVVINLSDGGGYFRPGEDDYEKLDEYIHQEQRRLITLTKPLRYAEKLRQDMKAGRI